MNKTNKIIDIIELSLWNMYKNLSREFIDFTNNENLLKYIFEINNIDLSNINDDYINKIKNIKEYKLQLDILNNVPKISQRSDEWYKMRQERLTASDTAQAIGKGKFGSKQQLIQKKAYEEASSNNKFGASIPALRHGIIFENMALRCYQQRRNNIIVHEFGLIPHSDISCYGASPDGISDLGIMIEIKCPLSRIINGTIPEQYMLQMMGQMSVCNLKECDYIECDIKEFKNIDEYLLEIRDHEKIDHGIIIELDNNKYIYSPEYYTKSMLLEWIEDQRKINNNIKKICPWKLNKIDVQRLHFDKELWNIIVPQIKQFWDEVLEIKKNKSKKYAILDDD